MKDEKFEHCQECGKLTAEGYQKALQLLQNAKCKDPLGEPELCNCEEQKKNLMIKIKAVARCKKCHKVKLAEFRHIVRLIIGSQFKIPDPKLCLCEEKKRK
jgi:hypothetical protein